MGYMGLDHSDESDNAADFVCKYKTAKTMVQRRKLISEELKNEDNDYNTSGWVNIALAMEEGVVRHDDLTATQKESLIELLLKEKLNSDSSKKSRWGDEKNRVMHNNAYKRLLKIVKTK